MKWNSPVGVATIGGVFAIIAALVGIIPSLVTTPSDTDVGSTDPITQQFRIHSASLEVSPSNYNGPCPITITFSGKIEVVGSGIVKYKIIDSETGSFGLKELTFEETGEKTVTEILEIDESGKSYSGWGQLMIMEPPQKSNEAEYSASCR